MNKKRFAMASVASFVFVFILDTVIHGFMLESTYAQTPNLWRSPEDMKMGAMMLAYAGMAIALTYLFTQVMNVRSCKQGIKAGVAIAVPMAIAGAAGYAWMPISLGLACAWFIATFIKVVGIAKISGVIYKDATEK